MKILPAGNTGLSSFFWRRKKDFRVRVAGAYCELLLVIFSPQILFWVREVICIKKAEQLEHILRSLSRPTPLFHQIKSGKMKPSKSNERRFRCQKYLRHERRTGSYIFSFFLAGNLFFRLFSGEPERDTISCVNTATRFTLWNMQTEASSDFSVGV